MATSNIKSDNFVFQILDIHSHDQEVSEEIDEVVKHHEVEIDVADDDDVYDNTGGRKYNSNVEKKQFVVHLFGTTQHCKSVRVNVVGFRPSFFIQLPETDESKAIGTIRRYMTAQRFNMTDVTMTKVMRKKFYGFTAKKIFPFLKMEVSSMNLFYRLRNLFLNKKLVPETRTKLGDPFKCAPAVYEANIDPMLRFIHTQNISPCGWVDITNGHLLIEDENASEWTLTCDYTDVKPATGPVVVAPYLLASWDIECHSVTGDFPLARRTWTRLAKDVLALPPSLSDTSPMDYIREQLVHRSDMYFVRSADRLNAVLENQDTAEAIMKEKELQAMEVCLGDVFDSSVQLLGDPIIQIGVVVRQQAREERHLFVFPTCDELDGIVVHAFEDERTMLLQWFEWIGALNPDILIGYNVFGFDEKYIWERAEELGIAGACSPIHKLTKLREFGLSVKCEEKFLSSSALGDNFMHVWSAHGRLQIDLYHYIRRMTTLPSYKLDSVVKHYMSGKLVSYTNDASSPCQLSLVLSGAIKDILPGRSLCLLDETGDTVTPKLSVVSVTDKTVVVSFKEDEKESVEMDDAKKWVVVKDDISPQDIFRLHKGSSADRAVVGRYCIQDCNLVFELYKKLDVFNNAMSMANVCSVPISYIFMRGQGVKIESLIFKACRERDILIQVMPAPKQYGGGGEGREGGEGDEENKQEDSYEGAIVLDPKPGFYSESPIGVADFASLYPSTIVSENISHDSLVWTKDFADDGILIQQTWGSSEYDSHKGYEYTDIEFDLLRPDPADTRKHPQKIKVGRRICRYAQPLDGTKATLPDIICNLLSQRKTARKEAAQEKNPERAALLDAVQLAYKLTANSLYGQLGSETFKVRLQHLAASVTAYGRKQIMFAKEVIERFYANRPDCCVKCSANVVYGDSVSGDTPVLIKYHDGPLSVMGIQNLFRKDDELWQSCHGDKECIDLSSCGVKIWTEKGFTHLVKIIRHKLGPTKKMFHVATPSGVVDVTEDHSLVAQSGEALKTRDAVKGTALLHACLPRGEVSEKNDKNCDISKSMAFLYGYNRAYNSCDMNDESHCDACKHYIGELSCKVIQFNELHKKNRLTLMDEIINSSMSVVESFWAGLCSGNHISSKCNYYIQIEEPDKWFGTYIYIIAQWLGYDVSIDTIDSPSKRSYMYTAIKRNTRTSEFNVSDSKMNFVQSIKSIHYNSEEYVYDVETANHHFGVGPGSLIVHNTDSLFVEFNPKNPETGEPLRGREAREATIELTEDAGRLVTKALKAPHDFEFDKIFDPLLMFSKKRYAGNMYEEDADHCVLKYMGIVLKRRDNAPIVKTIFGGALKKLLNNRDVAGATKFVQDTCMDLVNGKTSLYQLTITKSLRAEYANPGSIAHRVLADRIAKRDPGNAPTAGDRIEYVYIATNPGANVKLQGNRIETPAFARQNDKTPDYDFYIRHQIMNPISQMFGLVVTQMPGFDSTLLKKMPKDQEALLAWCENQASLILFDKCLKASNKKLEAVAKRNMFAGMMMGSGSKKADNNLAVVAVGTCSQQPQNTIVIPPTNVVENEPMRISRVPSSQSVVSAVRSTIKECDNYGLTDPFIKDGIVQKARRTARAKLVRDSAASVINKNEKEDKKNARAVRAAQRAILKAHASKEALRKLEQKLK